MLPAEKAFQRNTSQGAAALWPYRRHFEFVLHEKIVLYFLIYMYLTISKNFIHVLLFLLV